MIPASTIHEENNMGILDTISQLAGQAGDAAQGDQAKVAGGFIKALTDHPEGIQGVLASLQANGMADHIGSWAAGQPDWSKSANQDWRREALPPEPGWSGRHRIAQASAQPTCPPGHFLLRRCRAQCFDRAGPPRPDRSALC